MAFFIIASFVQVSQAGANVGLETRAEVRVTAPNEDIINLRRIDLQNKLFRERMEENRTNFQKAREDFKNSKPDNRNIMRSEFRAKFVERFSFAVEKLSDFQTRMSARIQKEQSMGVDVSKATIKLEESISFMAEIRIDIEKLKSILSERHAEQERETKREEVRILVEKIKTSIKASHMALRESIVELNKARSESNKVESSTKVRVNVNQ